VGADRRKVRAAGGVDEGAVDATPGHRGCPRTGTLPWPTIATTWSGGTAIACCRKGSAPEWRRRGSTCTRTSVRSFRRSTFPRWCSFDRRHTAAIPRGSIPRATSPSTSRGRGWRSSPGGTRRSGSRGRDLRPDVVHGQVNVGHQRHRLQAPERVAGRVGMCQLALDDFSREEDSVGYAIQAPAVGNAPQLVFAGSMFWFRWKTLSGSYLAFSSASRS